MEPRESEQQATDSVIRRLGPSLLSSSSSSKKTNANEPPVAAKPGSATSEKTGEQSDSRKVGSTVNEEPGTSSKKRKATPDSDPTSTSQGNAHEAKKQRTYDPDACSSCFRDQRTCDGKRPCHRCSLRGRKQCKEMTDSDREEAKRMIARPQVSIPPVADAPRKTVAPLAPSVQAPQGQLEIPAQLDTAVALKVAVQSKTTTISAKATTVSVKTSMTPKLASLPQTSIPSAAAPQTVVPPAASMQKRTTPPPRPNDPPKTVPARTSIVSKAPIEPPLPVSSLAAPGKVSKTSKPQEAPKIFTESEPTPRTRKPTEGKVYAPSHVQNIIKRGRDGAVPDASTLVLQDPREMGLRRTGTLDNTPATLNVTGPLPPSPKASNTKRQTSPKELSPTAQSIPIICFYFHYGKVCPDGEHGCRFLHRREDNMEIAVERLHKEVREFEADPLTWPKFACPTIVCGYMYKNHEGCFRSIDECVYAHWKPLKGEWKFHDQAKQKKTCSFWLTGNCFKPANVCEFAHERLDEVAVFTPRTCPFWYENYCGRGRPCVKGTTCKFSHEITPYIAFNPMTKAEARKCLSSLGQGRESILDDVG